MFIFGSVYFFFVVEDGLCEFGLCVELIKKYVKIYVLFDERF